MEEIKTKKCTKCGAEKPLSAFHRNVRTSDGFAKWCKLCKNEKRLQTRGLSEPVTFKCGYITHEGENGRLYFHEDLTGKRFGRWTALSMHEYVRNGKQHGVWWLCRCECGKERPVLAGRLTGGHSLSCGCLKTERQIAARRRKSVANTENRVKKNVYTKYVTNATLRGIEWSLTEEEVNDLITQNCHYCGAPPSNTGTGVAKGGFNTQGIDRKDNDLGYLTENVVPCCIWCNWAKSTHNYEDFMLWISRLVDYQNGRRDGLNGCDVGRIDNSVWQPKVHTEPSFV